MREKYPSNFLSINCFLTVIPTDKVFPVEDDYNEAVCRAINAQRQTMLPPASLLDAIGTCTLKTAVATAGSCSHSDGAHCAMTISRARRRASATLRRPSAPLSRRHKTNVENLERHVYNCTALSSYSWFLFFY